jgi:hypothetical protein
MTARARFSQADVTRAYRGAVKAGMSVQRIEICPATGCIVIIGGPPLRADLTAEPNCWDEVLNEWDEELK